MACSNTEKSINTIIANGKRSMAYGLIKLLQQQNRNDIIDELSGSLNATERKENKLHKVFETSFYGKE